MCTPSPTRRGLALPVLATLAASAPPIHAQPLAAPSAVETVFVTATNRGQPIADVQAAVQVITAEELATFAGMNVTEALQLAVGVDARPNGANSTVSIRGFAANAGSPVLVLIDGFRRPAKYGGVNLNLLPVESVERIEIVRGPMSALYGADAAGGVINIITKPLGRAASGSGSARLTLGTMQHDQRETLGVAATVNLAVGPTQHRLSVEHRRREAFRYVPSNYFADLGRINEQFVNYAGEWSIGAAQQLSWTLEGTWQRDTSPNLLAANPPARPNPVPFTGYEKETRHYGHLRYLTAIGPGELTLEASHGATDGATTRSFPNIETTDFKQTELRARYELPVGLHRLIVGGGWARDDIDVSITSGAHPRETWHALVQDELQLTPAVTLLAGVRRDATSDFGSVTTPRLSLGWREGPLTLRAGYGEAFRAPSALELYSRFFRGRFVIVGNPNLQPERNKSAEVAIGYQTRAFGAEIVYFDARARDLIQTVTRPRLPADPPSVTLRSEYSNVARAQLKGVEMSARARLGVGFDMLLGYDHLDARDASTGGRLSGRARDNLRLGLRFTQGPWQADLRHRHWFGFHAADPNARTAPPFNSTHSHTDLRLAHRWSPQVETALGVDNVFNKRQPLNWSAVGGTMEPAGRFFYATVRYGFGR